MKTILKIVGMCLIIILLIGLGILLSKYNSYQWEHLSIFILFIFGVLAINS